MRAQGQLGKKETIFHFFPLKKRATLPAAQELAVDASLELGKARSSLPDIKSPRMAVKIHRQLTIKH